MKITKRIRIKSKIKIRTSDPNLALNLIHHLNLHLNLTLPFCLSWFALFCSGCATPSRAPSNLLLISIDGLRADYVSQADRYGLKIPVLRDLMSQGVTAKRMIGIFPTVTYPSHVSIVTGNNPARHGVLSNELFYPLKEGRIDWHYSAKLIRCPTLWDRFADAHRLTGAVSWPVTVNARIDDLVPEKWDAADFNGTFIARSHEAATPGLIEAAEARFNFHFDIKQLEQQKNLVARHIVLTHQPALLLVHYDEVDKKQHALGPKMPGVFEALEQIDNMIGELLATYREAGYRVPSCSRLRDPKRKTPESTSNHQKELIVCIVSDHGFERVDKEFCPNVALHSAGLIDYDASAKKVTAWRAKAWLASGAAAIMLADPNDTDAAKRARDALQPYTGKPDSPIARIIDREEIRRLGSHPDAAFMLDAGTGYMFGRSIVGNIEHPSIVKGMHGQMPDRPELAAAFIIAGPGIPQGKSLDQIRMIDVAPTLAHLVGLKMSETDGHIIKSVTGAAQASTR